MLEWYHCWQNLLLVAITVTAPGVQGAITPEVAETIYAFAVGYVLVMSILGTTLMQNSDRIEAALVPRLEGYGARPVPSSD